MIHINIFSLYSQPYDLYENAGSGINIFIKEFVSYFKNHDVFIHIICRKTSQNQQTYSRFKNVKIHFIDDGHTRQLSRKEFIDLADIIRVHTIQYLIQNNLEKNIGYTHYWLSGLIIHPDSGYSHIHSNHTLYSSKVDIKKKNTDMLDENLQWKVENEIIQKIPIICNSDAEKQQIMKYYTPAKKILSIPAGCNTEVFKPKIQKSNDPDVFHCLYVGRFVKSKGIFDLLNAILILRQTQTTKSLCFEFIGGRNNTEEQNNLLLMKKFVQHNNLCDIIKFTPPKAHDEIISYYQKSDIVIIPSHYEPFGLVALEAMSCGVPVIATYVGGLQETIIHSKTGLHIKPNNPEEIASSILQMISQKNIEIWGQNARKHVIKNYSWSRITSQIYNYLSTITS